MVSKVLCTRDVSRQPWVPDGKGCSCSCKVQPKRVCELVTGYQNVDTNAVRLNVKGSVTTIVIDQKRGDIPP